MGSSDRCDIPVDGQSFCYSCFLLTVFYMIIMGGIGPASWWGGAPFETGPGLHESTFYIDKVLRNGSVTFEIEAGTGRKEKKRDIFTFIMYS